MQQKDMDALLRQFSQQSGDATVAARFKANMQSPQNQRAAQTILKQHGASLSRPCSACRRATQKALSKSFSARCRRRKVLSSPSKSPA